MAVISFAGDVIGFLILLNFSICTFSMLLSFLLDKHPLLPFILRTPSTIAIVALLSCSVDETIKWCGIFRHPVLRCSRRRARSPPPANSETKRVRASDSKQAL